MSNGESVSEITKAAYTTTSGFALPRISWANRTPRPITLSIWDKRERVSVAIFICSAPRFAFSIGLVLVLAVILIYVAANIGVVKY